MEEKDFFISGLPKEHGFEAPERYFDQLPNRIMQRTAHATPVGATAPVAWLKQFKIALAGTAMAVVFVLSFVATHTLSVVGSAPQASLTTVSDQEIEHYLLNQAELEASDIAEFAAVAPPHSLEFIEVTQEDINVDAAMELLEDKTESESLLKDEY